MLKGHIHIDGMPLHIIDTAGLQESPDTVEQIGIERAWQEINKADLLLFIQDGSTTQPDTPLAVPFAEKLQQGNALPPITIVRNKVDLTQETVAVSTSPEGYPVIHLSAKSQDGLSLLREHLKQKVGYSGSNEGQFMARRRHIDALQNAQQHVLTGQFNQDAMAGELLAEELRISQQYLSKLSEFSSDDLLGKIFSSFYWQISPTLISVTVFFMPANPTANQ